MQFQQCVVQQVRPEILMPTAEDKKKKKAAVGESAASLLQLPGVDVEVVRALDKSARIRSLQVWPPPPVCHRTASPVFQLTSRERSHTVWQASQGVLQPSCAACVCCVACVCCAALHVFSCSSL